VQRGLGFTQQQGDLIGFSLFAVGMTIGRVWYGLRGDGHDLPRLLMLSGCASAAVYLTAALSPWTIVGFIASCSAGLAVGMLWPATISLAAARWPLAGATVFAVLAVAGDAGAAAAVWLVGAVADVVEIHPELAAWLPGGSTAGGGLRAGILVGAMAPLGMVAVAWYLGAQARREGGLPAPGAAVT
jgi:fucose permease